MILLINLRNNMKLYHIEWIRISCQVNCEKETFWYSISSNRSFKSYKYEITELKKVLNRTDNKNKSIINYLRINYYVDLNIKQKFFKIDIGLVSIYYFRILTLSFFCLEFSFQLSKLVTVSWILYFLLIESLM